MASALRELEAGASDSSHERGPRKAIRRSVGALRKPLQSLRTKILLFVLSATLATSLAVTGVSVHVVEDFVQSEVEDELYSFLVESAARIAEWYRKRFDEIEVFADAKTLYQNLPPNAYDRAQIDQYLHNIANNLPDMVTFFLLDATGRIAGWAGEEFTLPPTLLLTLTNVQETGLSDLLNLPPGDLQIISAPVRNPSGAHVGTLHAVLDTETLLPMLHAADLSDFGRFILVDGRTQPIVSSSPQPERLNDYLSATGVLDGGMKLKQYQNSRGQWVVGTSLEIPLTRQVLILEESYSQIFDPVTEILYKTLFINLAVVSLFAILAFLVTRSIVRPIDTLVKNVQRIAQGEPDALSHTPGKGEVGVLANAISMMMTRLESKTRRLEQLSKTDGLTGLYNHRVFKAALRDEAVKVRVSGEPLALVLVDIDHFKAWNDHHGHDHGDEILRVVARVMADTIRGSDLLARYGGDEFAILARNTNLTGARVLAQKLCMGIAETGSDLSDKNTPPLSVSVGIAQYSDDLNKFFKDADRALYSAKRSGRNCVRAP